MRDEAVLEMMAFWEGGVKAREVARALGTTREHVQRTLLLDYRNNSAPTALKRGRFGVVFTEGSGGLRYAPDSIRDLMAVLRGEAAAARASGDSFPFRLNVESAPVAASADEGDADLFQEICAASVHRLALRLDYVAKSGLRQFWFSPHSIVDVHPLPHFRGCAIFDGGATHYIDMVPPRIASIHGRDGERYVGGAGDTEWHERMDVVFELDPLLDHNVRASLMEEAGGCDRLVFPNVRRALVDYVARDLGLRMVGGVLRSVWRRADIEAPAKGREEID